mgnify:CR=1 FL=1|jgi:hypothetical protein
MTFDQAWPLICSVAGGVGSYYGALMAMREMLARHDERLKAVERRMESDHAALETLESVVYRGGQK